MSVKKKPGSAPSGKGKGKEKESEKGLKRDEAFLEELRQMKQELLSEMTKQQQEQDAGGKNGGCVIM